MDQVKGIPYGISDFNRMRNENFYFVDKTMYLPLIEKMPSYLFLIRPRRFGKSLFLSMMRTYYDILQLKNFDKYFGDLWIGNHLTEQRNRFQVLYFDFSKASCSRPGADLMTSFNDYCSIIINQFAHEYSSFYDPDFKTTVKNIESAKSKLSYIEVKAKEKGYPLYLIIDEYDNFTNIILSEHGQKMFHDLIHASGFYHEYFKQFKGMFDRIFMMGVSPVTLDDLSSGYNIDWNISTDETFNAMMGFKETEAREMFEYYQQNNRLTGDIETMIAEMKPWYDNYCFARMSLDHDRIFNCDMTLYYLNNQIQQSHTINLSHLKDLIDDFAFDGHWKPFFESIAHAYRENSSVRDTIEGERNLQGFLKAYLALASYYLMEPEPEMNYGYCDFFLLPDKQRYPDVKHSYILELKYAVRTATDAELELQAEAGRRQLLQYSKDKVARRLAQSTTLHKLLLQFRGWDMIRCEEI